MLFSTETELLTGVWKAAKSTVNQTVPDASHHIPRRIEHAMPFIQLFDCFLNTFFAGPRKPAFAELALNQGSFSIRMAGDASDEIYRLLQLALQNQENGMVMHL